MIFSLPIFQAGNITAATAITTFNTIIPIKTRFGTLEVLKGRIPSFLQEHILPDVLYCLIFSFNLLIGIQYLMHYTVHLLQSPYLPGLQKRRNNYLPTIFSSLCFVPALIP